MEELNKNYYKVICKCGHVGRKHYVPIQFAIIAENGKEAAKIGRNLPRVKHQHKDAVLNVIKISYEDYLELKEININDPYLKCKNKQQQKKICDLTNRIEIDEHNIVKPINKSKRKERVEYLLKKQKLVERLTRKECLYEYNY